jgi:hypothetical protein
MTIAVSCQWQGSQRDPVALYAIAASCAAYSKFESSPCEPLINDSWQHSLQGVHVSIKTKTVDLVGKAQGF